MSLKPIGIGVIGCGAISYTYLSNLTSRFNILKVVGVADLIEEKAKARAEEFGGLTVMTNDEIYNHPDIQIVVNLTNVWSHFEVSKAALEHGKHVYSEKMMAENYEDAKILYDLAKEKGLRFSCAPDTFLGGGYQTCRKLIDDGYIGTPLAVNATIVRSYLPGSPAPRKGNVTSEGGTIPFDMGGYYIHAMQCLFGSVKRVSGFAKRLPKIYSHPMHPQYKETFLLEHSPNFIQAALEFDCGVLGTLTALDSGIMSPEIPGITVYGTDGILICPDPNMFTGPVKLLRNGGTEYVTMPLTHGFNGEERNPFAAATVTDPMKANWATSRRGVGVADIAWAITNNRPQRISAEMSLHTIEIIHGVDEATKTGKYYEMTTHPERPAALRPGFVGMNAEAVFDD